MAGREQVATAALLAHHFGKFTAFDHLAIDTFRGG